MKHFYQTLFFLLLYSYCSAQIISIPNATFKAKLLSPLVAKDLNGNNLVIDANGDGEIQVSEAENVGSLNLSSSNISSFVGIEFFTNVTFLDCTANQLNTLDVSQNVKLTSLTCDNNKLTTLDVSKNVNLTELHCYYNQLTVLDVSKNVNLTILVCDYNQLTSLDVSKNVNLTDLYFGSNQLTSLDVSKNLSLNRLVCYENLLTSLDVSQNVNLTVMNCSNNSLTSLDVSQNVNLIELRCESNLLTSLDVSKNVKIESLFCIKNLITSLDFSKNVKLVDLYCSSNLLISLNIKHWPNNFNKYLNVYQIFPNPNLKYICCDIDEIAAIQKKLPSGQNIEINSYCSFTPGGTYYTIEGNTKLDTDTNGCDVNDAIYQNLKFGITDGTHTGNFISNTSGSYSIPVQDGTHTITPILENPTYFTVAPASLTVTFPTESSPFIQNFCITPNGSHQDLEVTVLPLTDVRPGFDATYKIVYKNKGNVVQSGSVALTFIDALLDYVSATPIINDQINDKLTWNYTNLQPFETREITITLNANAPTETPALNIDDQLSFNALITPVTGDEKPIDNTVDLNQTIVGSLDPNDKTCLEGAIVTPSLIGQYVNYMIRFENTGNYAAQNVVVKDVIDLKKFDISSLIPTKASHSYITKISEGNKVEFIFENINLPFDDATNDGYIAFKIKTLPTLLVGDIFENEANIYFDYNFPVLTNKASSTFKTLGTQNFEFSNYFNVYPIPAKDILTISLKKSIVVKSIAIYDILGQVVLAIPNAQTVSKIDITKLTSGNFLLK